MKKGIHEHLVREWDCLPFLNPPLGEEGLVVGHVIDQQAATESPDAGEYEVVLEKLPVGWRRPSRILQEKWCRVLTSFDLELCSSYEALICVSHLGQRPFQDLAEGLYLRNGRQRDDGLEAAPAVIENSLDVSLE